MYELTFNDLYELQIKKIKLTYRKGKIAAAIAMISAIVGVVAIIFTIYYFATALLQSDFTEAVQLLWNLVAGAVSKLF
jgi:fatty acid desaturase